MDKEKPFVVVIGRIQPIGCSEVYHPRDVTVKRKAVVIHESQPLCQQVKLERIVPQPAVGKEQAEKDFLALTDGL